MFSFEMYEKVNRQRQKEKKKRERVIVSHSHKNSGFVYPFVAKDTSVNPACFTAANTDITTP